MLDTWLKMPDIHLQRQKSTLKHMQNHTFYKNFYQMKTVSITVLMIVFFYFGKYIKKVPIKDKGSPLHKMVGPRFKKNKKS